MKNEELKILKDQLAYLSPESFLKEAKRYLDAPYGDKQEFRKIWSQAYASRLTKLGYTIDSNFNIVKMEGN